MGKVVISAVTIAASPKFASAPRINPQGNNNILAAACLETGSS